MLSGAKEHSLRSVIDLVSVAIEGVGDLLGGVCDYKAVVLRFDTQDGGAAP
jgi:hypothetical protein